MLVEEIVEANIGVANEEMISPIQDESAFTTLNLSAPTMQAINGKRLR